MTEHLIQCLWQVTSQNLTHTDLLVACGMLPRSLWNAMEKSLVGSKVGLVGWKCSSQKHIIRNKPLRTFATFTEHSYLSGTCGCTFLFNPLIYITVWDIRGSTINSLMSSGLQQENKHCLKLGLVYFISVVLCV